VPLLSSGNEHVLRLGDVAVAAGAALDIGVADHRRRTARRGRGRFVTLLVPLLAASDDSLFIARDWSTASRAMFAVAFVNAVVLQRLLVLCGLKARAMPLLAAGNESVLIALDGLSAAGTQLLVPFINPVVGELCGGLRSIMARAVPLMASCHNLLDVLLNGLVASGADFLVASVDLVGCQRFDRLLSVKARFVPLLSCVDDLLLVAFNAVRAARACLCIAALNIVGLDFLGGFELRNRVGAVLVPNLSTNFGRVGTNRLRTIRADVL